ncbi:hypothetical protein I546_0622 [Mycobacterium kansasii 732]|nr:hypothetical protein I546_0622 [Mycobacterium kansasii 732]
MFHAQKLTVETQVARAKFAFRCAPISGVLAVSTAIPNHLINRLETKQK